MTTLEWFSLGFALGIGFLGLVFFVLGWWMGRSDSPPPRLRRHN